MMIEKLKTQTVQELTNELKEILAFWMENTIDEVNGGFIGEISGVGEKHPEAEKGAVLNARLLWTFSAAYNFNKDPKYLKMADRAYRFLIDHFWDKENGGVFWSLDSKGIVNNSRKQAYAQGFAIYGLSEYHKASANVDSLKYAQELYQLIEKYYLDSKDGGYIEALANDWTVMDDMRLSPKDANEPKSMNTHLHIIEPYANLYRVWPDAGLKKSIQHLLDVFYNRIINQETSHFELFFDYDWTVKSSIVSYGHDIEGAWLLTEAAEVIEDEEWLQQMREVAIRMVDVTLEQGADKDGSVFYEKEGSHLDSDKHWWPQAEAMVGLLEAYHISKQELYLDAFSKVWYFVLNQLKDKTNGEWFWKVSIEGEAGTDMPKVGFWKCPYHNSRALIEAVTRLSRL